MQDPDSIIMSIAARQHGILALWQLIREGVPRHIVEHRIRQHRLQRLHRCVYRLASLAGPHEREMAAVLSCGEFAVLSHLSSAALHALLPPVRGDVSVSVPRGHPRTRPGVRVYRVLLPPTEITELSGVPVTTPPRTLLDLAGIVTTRELEQAVAQALRQELTTESEIFRVLNRYPRRPGGPALRALLAMETPLALTESEAEERFLGLVRCAQLPPPATNVYVSGFNVDFYWRAEGLIAEIDGLAYHSARQAMVRDRRRDAVLTAAGRRVMRFTWQTSPISGKRRSRDWRRHWSDVDDRPCGVLCRHAHRATAESATYQPPTRRSAHEAGIV